MTPLSSYLVFSALLFSIGLVGILVNRRNIIVILMGIELMALASVVNFVAFSTYGRGISGLVFAMLILALAASEAAVALAVLVSFYRHKRSIEVGETARGD